MDEDRDQQSKDAEKVHERTGLRTPVIYEIVRQRGDEEMARPITSLWWSGIAAGLSMSFSLLAQSILEMHLADTPWRTLIGSFGYCVGFLMVVLGRQQLFTENTITAVLPVMAHFTAGNVGRMLRMWAVVFVANSLGTLIAALFCTLTPVVNADELATMIEVSGRVMRYDWIEMFFRGITAGFLIAAMVWLIPSAEAAQFWVIALMTYLIAVGQFMHVVAGSVEAFLLLVNGHMTLGTLLGFFTLPVLLGNVVGGTVLFALLSYAQVMKEI